MLGWTQQQLASASGLSKTAIINFERGLSDIKADTLMQIKRAFEHQNLQFGELDRVQRREDNCTMASGPEKLFQILQQASKEQENHDNEILISFLSEQEILRRNLEAFYEITRFWEKSEIRVRYLLSSGDFLFLQPFANYRWVPEELGTFGMTSIVYGSRVSVKFWGCDTFVNIDSPQLAKAERERFEAMWRISRAPPVRRALDDIAGMQGSGTAD